MAAQPDRTARSERWSFAGTLARIAQGLQTHLRGSTTPEPRSPLEQLREVRRQIDTLDRELMRLLVARASLARSELAAKQQLGTPVVDPEHERALLALRRQWAYARGFETEAIAAIFAAVIAFSRGLQGVRS